MKAADHFKLLRILIAKIYGMLNVDQHNKEYLSSSVTMNIQIRCILENLAEEVLVVAKRDVNI